MDEKSARLRFDVFYLHGFASSPSSTKALRFKKMLMENGASVEIPDLNFPSFKDMTLTSQLGLVLNRINRLPDDAPVVLVGSSMGGLLATLLSQRTKKITALILMAPGFGIARRWKEFVSAEEYEIWKSTGVHSFFHYAHNKELPLGYEFAKDLERINTDDLVVDLPCLVFHGEHDQTVTIDESKRFARLNKSVDLRILNDDHQLINSLDHMLSEALKFLRSQK